MTRLRKGHSNLNGTLLHVIEKHPTGFVMTVRNQK